MIMSASERTHPSSHRSIRDNAKHKRFCRWPYRPRIINSCASWTPKTRLLRGIPSPPALVVCGSSLPRALALSLEDTTAEGLFQADLQRALQESQSQSTLPHHPPQTAAPNTTAKPGGFLSERAQLERERLARQKRLRGDADDRNSSRGPTPSTSTSTADSESDDDESGRPAAKRQHLATPRQSRILQQSGSKRSANVINGSSKPGTSTNQPPMFWRGEIRQTANMHVDPKKDTNPTFRLSEIIGEVRPAPFLSQSPHSDAQLTDSSNLM